MSGHLFKKQQFDLNVFLTLDLKINRGHLLHWASTVPGLATSSKGVKRNIADIAWSIQTNPFLIGGRKNGNGYQMFTGLLNYVSQRIGNLSHITEVNIYYFRYRLTILMHDTFALTFTLWHRADKKTDRRTGVNQFTPKLRLKGRRV